MAAVTVTGVLTDFGRATLESSLVPVLEFQPSGASKRSDRLFASRPIKATLNAATGAWSVLLEETELFAPEVWYTPVIRYYAKGGQFQHEDRLPIKVRVPVGGGSIGTFPSKPNPGSIVAGFGKPEPRHSASAYLDLNDVTPEGVMLYLPKGSF